MTLESEKPNLSPIPHLFHNVGFWGRFFPEEEDPIVISVITMGRNVHKVLVDHVSSVDVMFW